MMSKLVHSGNTSYKRRRTKKIVKDIKQQIEFYFSDANLCRDKFMLNLVGPNGDKYVLLDVLRSFNQMKQLSVNICLLQKAVLSSDILQLNQEKNAVRRKTMEILPLPSNIEDCTIFVECLPPYANISWLKEVCKKIGQTGYITLPRYKSGFIKGFAFIEFLKPNDAAKACSILNSPPKNFFFSIPVYPIVIKPKYPLLPIEKLDFTNEEVLSNTVICPSHELCQPLDAENSFDIKKCVQHSLCSNHIKRPLPFKYIDQRVLNKNDNDISKDSLSDISQSCETSFNTNSTSEFSPTTWPSHFSGSKVKPVVNSVVTYSNKKKRSYDHVSKSSHLFPIPAKRTKKTMLYANSSTPSYVFTNPADVKLTTSSKKKHRKRTRRTRHKVNSNKTISSDVCLRAMMKRDWLEYRKQYLHKQRESYGKLKSILQKLSSPDPDTSSIYIKHHLALKKSAAENYLDVSDTENDVDESNGITYVKCLSTNKTHKTPVFVPGVVVAVSSLNAAKADTNSPSTLPNFKLIKEHFSQYGKVAYVDVDPFSSHGYVRFETSEDAQRAILEDKQFGICLLTGVKEEKYWDSLLVSCQLKRTRERSRNSGKEKLIFRANRKTDLSCTRHIKFNEDFH